MKKLKHLVDLFQDPKFLRQFHGYATIMWMILVIPSLLFWSESVMWVVLLSVWANIASHWASWQAARAEVKIDDNGDNEN
jgi:hypothetical protein